jgi:hypothetical protein
MATLLAKIMFRNSNSSLLRWYAVHQSFFSIRVYTIAALGRVLMDYAALL